MKVYVRMLTVLSNRVDYLKRRYKEECKFLNSDSRYASWENAITFLETNTLTAGQADAAVDLLVNKEDQPKEGRPAPGADVKEFIMWFRLELQRRWLAWLIDFTVETIQISLDAVQQEDQGKNVQYVVALPEFYFTDRSRGLTAEQIDQSSVICDTKFYHNYFTNPFEERVFFEFANGWLPTYQKLKTLESLTDQNLILFGGTIIWNFILTKKDPETGEETKQEIINNTLPVFFNRRCQFLWDKQHIPDGEIPPKNVHPTSELPWLSVESFSIMARGNGKVPVPAFEYLNDTVFHRPMIFAVDICKDFIDGMGKRQVTAEGITPDFHVIVAAGASFRIENVCAKHAAFYADNREVPGQCVAGIINANNISCQYLCLYNKQNLCWASNLSEWDIDI